MNKKVTFFSFLIILIHFFGVGYAQTHVYNDETTSGIWFQSSDGSEVDNPVSDNVNSSATCAQNGTDGTWQQIQFFPTYTPEEGDKLFFSIYNPNNTGPGQVQFRYQADQSTWQFGDNITYTAESGTGWVEYSIDLSSHAGNLIDQVIIMPSGDNASATYLDNIYFGAESVINNVVESPLVYNDTISSGIWFQSSDGSEVDNPVSDNVNSSATCAQNGTDGTWQQIQFFPTYTPKEGDKLFFSIYNPNNTGPGQIQFRYQADQSAWQFGDNITYTAESQNGWVEYSIDLTSHVGNLIDQVIIMPSGDNASATYVDNVYFGTESIIITRVESPLVYNDTISSGIWFQSSDGAEVANPVSDNVNSSATCAQNGTDGTWQQIQFFPFYTPVEDDTLFFSIYNPNNTGPGQVQFRYKADQSTWQFGGNITYTAESQSGWVEYSLDVSSHVGNLIDQVIIMPSGDNASATYVDNVYFGVSSLIPVGISEHVKNDELIYIDTYGRVKFDKDQTNTKIQVYDISGRLLFIENIQGNTSTASLATSGIYILRMKKGNIITGRKLVY